MKYSTWTILGDRLDGEKLDVQTKLLANRNVFSHEEKNEFLLPSVDAIHNPYLMQGMDKCIARLSKSLQLGENIGILGDFDTDGLTGTALLTEGLRNLGGNAFPYIPHRVTEGHGISENALAYFQQHDVTLQVTVDCGVTALPEISKAKEQGIDTIVTDHHTPLDNLPDAVSIINPSLKDSSYPFPFLTGVGTAFKVIQALHQHLNKPLPDKLYTLVALGTLSDVGYMKGENRYLVWKGLQILRRFPFTGIDALIDKSYGVKNRIKTEDMSFGVIPRLNVAGRLKHAKLSLDILLSKNPEDANKMADELDELNKQRQKLTEKAFEEAHRQVSMDEMGKPPAVIFAGKATWAPGILGLIASRLSEEFHRPAIAACGENGLYRGSARSIPEFNLIDALNQCEEHFEAYGGHPMAAGFTIKEQSLKKFRNALTTIGQEQMTDIPKGPSLSIETSIPFSWINRENLNFINQLEPFGNGNPNPVFMTQNVSVLGVRQIGANKSHLKMTVEDQGKIFDTICFRQGSRIKEAHGSIDIAYTAGTSYWSGRETIELTVQDFRPSTTIEPTNNLYNTQQHTTKHKT